jgi:hypothetical protein
MHHETISRDHAADGLLAEFAHGLFGSVPQRSLRIKAGQAGTGNQPGKQQPVYIRNAFIVAIMDGHCGTLLCRGREAKANALTLPNRIFPQAVDFIPCVGIHPAANIMWQILQLRKDGLVLAAHSYPYYYLMA